MIKSNRLSFFILENSTFKLISKVLLKVLRPVFLSQNASIKRHFKGDVTRNKTKLNILSTFGQIHWHYQDCIKKRLRQKTQNTKYIFVLEPFKYILYNAKEYI
jgi:hypothetical protein